LQSWRIGTQRFCQRPTPTGRRHDENGHVPVADHHLEATVERLAASGCVAAEDEAAAFLRAAPDAATLDRWLARREQGEPPAWITGVVEFAGRELHIGPGVYVPRQQTEELARRAASRLPEHGQALDLCTGAGAVAASLMAQVPTATVIGVDRDERAARCARANGVPTVVADLASPLRARPSFDVVTAVPPYVPTSAIHLLPADVQRHEPRVALDGGADGLDLVRQVVAAASRLLRPGGWLLIELGGDQDEALAPALATATFTEISPWWDDDGDLRGLAAQLAAEASTPWA
jgi:release factor glutamine methyltransferase